MAFFVLDQRITLAATPHNVRDDVIILGEDQARFVKNIS